MRRWKLFLAFFRLSKSAVCEMSEGRGPLDDFHDYADGDDAWEGWPVHGWTYQCKRCGKAFQI